MQKHAFKDLSKNSCSMDLRVIEKVLEGIKLWGIEAKFHLVFSAYVMLFKTDTYYKYLVLPL